jgi:hypothetical protein
MSGIIIGYIFENNHFIHLLKFIAKHILLYKNNKLIRMICNVDFDKFNDISMNADIVNIHYYDDIQCDRTEYFVESIEYDIYNTRMYWYPIKGGYAFPIKYLNNKLGVFINEKPINELNMNNHNIGIFLSKIESLKDSNRLYPTIGLGCRLISSESITFV